MIMGFLRDKRLVKQVSLVVAMVFVLGVAGMALTQSNSVGLAAAPSGVGVVTWQVLMMQHPDMQIIKAAMDNEIEVAKKEFESKAKGLSQEEQQKLYMQHQERLSDRERDLMKPLFEKINNAIKKVADAKGLSIVVDRQGVLYGGTDITEEVMKSYK